MSKSVSWIDCLQVYCPTYHRLYEMACLGDGVITFHGALVATIDRSGEVPHFTFTNNLNDANSDLQKYFEQRQFMFKPYMLDQDYSFFHDIPAIAQEVRGCLTFEEALHIRFIRDNLKGDWGDRIPQFTIDKMIKAIEMNGRVKYETAQKIVKHLAMCAIINI